MAGIPVALCSVEGCEVARRKRDWCGRHYQAWRRHGDPTVAKYEWIKSTGRCIVCNSPSLMPASRRYCSKACSQAVSRARRGGNSLDAVVLCQGCGDEVDVRRENGKRVRKGSSKWCADCKAQRIKHRVSAKMLARRDGDICRECGSIVDLNLPAPDPLSPSIDRIVARARGGTDEPSNLQLVHRVCNQSKGDLLAHERLVEHCTAPGCQSPLCNRAMGLCLRHMKPFYRNPGSIPAEKRGHKAYRRLSA
jgi:hypothetical protein